MESQVITANPVLGVGMAVSAPRPSHEPERQRYVHLLAPASDESVASIASVVVADARGQETSQARSTLHDNVARYRFGALVIGAVTTPRSALVWIRDNAGRHQEEPTGYAVEVCGDRPGPAELYPSVLYTWLRWWYEQTRSSLPPGDQPPLQPPQPPAELTALLPGAQQHLTVRDARLDTRGNWGRTVSQAYSEPHDPWDPLYR
ncbi:hypothetical protein [Streptomyces acidiscabies]|uniref:hypothetical protein n=1 Tax=Streptomyces acidiscabies TaxID=42234 RepID=UPI00028A3624|nr:hypothetical protein [Streptomyces acidiscabies]